MRDARASQALVEGGAGLEKEDALTVGFVDDDDLVLLVDLLSYTDEMVRFKCQGLRGV